MRTHYGEGSAPSADDDRRATRQSGRERVAVAPGSAAPEPRAARLSQPPGARTRSRGCPLERAAVVELPARAGISGDRYRVAGALHPPGAAATAATGPPARSAEQEEAHLAGLDPRPKLLRREDGIATGEATHRHHRL